MSRFSRTVIHNAVTVRSLLMATAVLMLVVWPAGAADDRALGDPTLLMTEIAVTPTGGEFVEIHNPTAAPIDLSDVYLTDATHYWTYPTDLHTAYYKIVTGVDAGGGGYGDFHARFPAGARILPGEYQVVALAGSDAFFAEFEVQPTYELWEDGGLGDDIPDMREAVPGSINGQGGLSNSGEVVILYTWDGASDLVADLDYVVWGDQQEAIDKTGVSIDGPDAGTTESTYLNDTALASQDIIGPTGHPYGSTWQRTDLDEGTETSTGGNGLTGHDETSENVSSTWTVTSPSPDPGSGATILLNEIVVTPAAGAFVEIFNPSAAPVDLSNYYLTDATYAAGGTYYYNIVTGANAGGGSLGDFLARFPDGATIAAGGLQTVAISGSDDFFAEYGVNPTYELSEDGGAPDAIPDMREGLTGSIAGQGELDETGEVAILFFWDGASDLVFDVDYAVWGDKDEAVDKTGVAVDGPDADAETSAYYDDTAIADQDMVAASAHASGESYARVDPGEGMEVEIGGNGMAGDDETSEDLSVTWRVDSTPSPNDPPTLEIFEIQGAGESSSWEGQTITTSANVVTAVGSQGFFIQTPDARDDLNVDTSNGMYVYTGSVPTVSVGDSVDVTATVQEYYGLTEFSGTPQVTVVGTDGVPPPIGFSDTVPSPDPASPSCAIQYECWEGMLVDVPVGTATGSNQYYSSDEIAEFHAVARVGRAYREIGAEYPGLGGSIPVYDGNPEIFEVDVDKLGLANAEVPAGSSLSATGVLSFDFGDYELWATAFSVTPVTLPVPVQAASPDELTVASYNLYRLYDDVDDPGNDSVVSTAEYQRRLGKHSMYIREVLLSPDVVAVQEVEKIEVLTALAAQILADDPSVSYTGYLVDGNDYAELNIGHLVRDTVAVTAVTQLGGGETFEYNANTYTTHDRPPLLLEGSFSGGGSSLGFAVLDNHVRSQIDANTNPWVRQKRFEQAQSIAQMVQDFQTASPDTPLIVAGDLNAFQFTDGYVDVVGQICGNVDPSQNLLSGPDLVDPNLVIQVNRIDPQERYSYVYLGSAQVFDHALTSSAATPWVTGAQYGRGNTDSAVQHRYWSGTPLRASDHDGLVLYMTTSGIFADGFESGDTTAWSNTIP